MSGKPSSTITAIVNTFNRRALLGRAIESILKQRCPVDEIVVVDDGSTDGTEHDIPVMSFRSVAPMRYVRNANIGLPASRNTGLREATSDFIAFLDDDDVWDLDHIGRHRDSLSRFPDVVLFGGLGERLGEEHSDLANVPERFFAQYETVESSDHLQMRRQGRCTEPFYVPHLSTSLVRRDAALSNLFDEELLLRGDLLFVWRLGAIGDIVLDRTCHAQLDLCESSLASAARGAGVSVRRSVDVRRAFYTVKLAQKAWCNGDSYGSPQCAKELGEALFTYAYMLALNGERRRALSAWRACGKVEEKLGLRHIRLLARIVLGGGFRGSAEVV